MPRRPLWIAGAVAVVAVVVIGLVQSHGTEKPPKAIPFDLQAAQRQLAGAPAPLARLHAQANQVLGGGTTAVRARLAALKGHPVVVNKWASWCRPCRAEFPVLQQASVRFGKQVAFLGLDSGDGNGEAARDFLARFPLPYPTYVDPNSRAATAIGAGANFPTTVFYDAAGRQRYIHQGVYYQPARLAADIEHFALDRP